MAIRVAALQVNTVVGDFDANVARIAEFLGRAEEQCCDLAVAPELAITGYPPEDLLLKRGFVAANVDALEEIARGTRGMRCAALVGYAEPRGGSLYNAAALVADGQVRATFAKRVLPNYTVFDEERYFEPGENGQPLAEVAGMALGVLICEDVWFDAPFADVVACGADAVVVLNASPFYAGRIAERIEEVSKRCSESRRPAIYVNSVGGQDELVFDGGSFAVDGSGAVTGRAAQFTEELFVADLGEEHAVPGRAVVMRNAQPLEPLEEIYSALVLGTRDYVGKNGFSDVVIGLSGGIDSSLVATVATDALGAARVHGVAMPSRYSSPGSVDDATELASRLGIELRVIPIEAVHAAFGEMFAATRGATALPVTGLADENLQSRIRGVTLMALSNQYGWLVLTTGNKSEMAVGYSTLYGDSAGGFAVIKDVAKTQVYALCRWRNAHGADVIPETVLTKAPSAELRPDQRDDQTLPPYDELDAVVEAYVEEDCTVADLVDRGIDAELARRVASLVDVAEYKRRQSPPGVRVTRKAFGKDRRMPVTNGYRALLQQHGPSRRDFASTSVPAGGAGAVPVKGESP